MKTSFPRIVVAADWSIDEKKRWMVRAECDDSQQYVVYPPEPVGDRMSLITRLRGQVLEGESVLIGFDFPIGLPVSYARSTGITLFRTALGQFGSGKWHNFYTISDAPSQLQPFSPLPTQRPGNYREQLAKALGFQDLFALRRRCDKKTATRRAAECLFYTLGGAQVGAGTIVGWRDVIQPALVSIRLWPFDGDLPSLLAKPGVTIVEIYPAEAYSHLGIRIGIGTSRTKTSRKDRKEATQQLLGDLNAGPIRLCRAAKSWIEWGFLSEDDFDAMVGLLSMLRIVTGQRSSNIPDCDEVRLIEGWILGQEFADE
jgi:hypothetical protein